ncbi:MAG: hypothetical protein M1368_09800 [Thaumarchaeota archaeon]|nr:hypothetical protein [Nitrososphaerota archaeon]
MKAANSFNELFSASDAALNKLGYEFHRNGYERFAEFEVVRPSEFTIRIEDMSSITQRDWKLSMFTKEEFGCSILILTPNGNSQSAILASKFVRELVQNLKRKPWDGLGHVRSRTAKILWERWQKIAHMQSGENFPSHF